MTSIMYSREQKKNMISKVPTSDRGIMKALTPPVDMQRLKLRDVREHGKRKLDEFALLSSIFTFSYLQILKDTVLKSQKC